MVGNGVASAPLRFHGAIAGVGSTSGVRVVVGKWARSPWGSFADVMLERADGHRVLLAPTEPVASFVGALYGFDTVRVDSVTVAADAHGWRVSGPGLELRLGLGRRTGPGWALRVVPPLLAAQPWFCAALDPIARRIVSGVRTRGRSGGREEFYGALDQHAVTSLAGHFDATPLGDLRPVLPPVRFGFSSAPARPTVTRLVTTVREDRGGGVKPAGR